MLDLPDATLRDHLRVTGGWLVVVMGLTAGVTAAAAAAAGSAPLLLAAALLLAGSTSALQVRAMLQARVSDRPRRAARLWPLAWGSVAALACVWLYSDVPGSPEARPWALGAGLGASVLSAGIARYWARTPLGLAPWACAASWLFGLSTMAHLLSAWWSHAPAAAHIVSWWLLLTVALEGVARSLHAVFLRAPPPPPTPWGLRLLFSAADPVSSLFGHLDRSLGIDLRHTWALTWARRSMAPLAAILAAIGWGATAVTVVEVQEEGVLERLGRPVDDLGPGLHLHWPWPVDRVRRVDVHRVREHTIGYTGASEAASLLWTKTHATEEYALLLGDGRDLVAVNARLQYRPRSARSWLYGVRNPEAGVVSAAYRALTDRTRGASLEGVLSENLGQLSSELESEIRAAAEPLGVQVVAFTLDGLHPPVAVADRYQAVVSAQVDRQTTITEAQAYRAGRLPEAEAEATRLLAEAEAAGPETLGRARGEAEAFTSLAAAHARAPALFETRRRLETLEAAVEGRPFTLVDSRFEAAGGILWVTE